MTVSILYTEWRSFVKRRASGNQLERRDNCVPVAISGDLGHFSFSSGSPAFCPWPRSVHWRLPYQKDAPGTCWHPESKTQHTEPASPREAFGIYTPGSVGPVDWPATGNDSMTYGKGTTSSLCALDLSCSDGSFSRDQGAAAAISRSRYIECLKSLTAKG